MLPGYNDLYAVALAISIALGAWHLLRRWHAPRTASKSERKPGEWTPVPFRYPPFEPHPDFDLHTTPPIPYRPFRWGKYPITMDIRAMQWDAWIELDNEYLELLKIRKARIATRGDKVVRTLPGAEAAALEVCTELAAYLAQRYPQIFRVHRVPSPHGTDSIRGPAGGRIKVVEILPTGDRWDLDVDDPMVVGGLLADDLGIVVEGADGRCTLQAGCVCLAGSWRLEDKIGLTLEDIHVKGRVPMYKEKLQVSMDRFFRRMAVDKPVERNNYTFQADPNLPWASTLHGDEDNFDQWTKGPPTGSGPDLRLSPDPNALMSSIYFRTERQTLRRMPQTGCICFTIRTYFLPVTEIVREVGVPGRLAAAIRGWPEEVLRRKDTGLYRERMLPWLDELHATQGAGAEDRTSRYPL